MTYGTLFISKYNINDLKIVPDYETWLYTMLNTVVLEHQCSIMVMYAVLHSKVSGSSPGISKGVLVTQIMR